MAGTATRRAPRKAAKAASAATGLPEPPELAGFYGDVEAAASDDAVSLDLVTKTGPERQAEREKLFSIDGREYTIPKKFGPNLALVYIDAVGQLGEDVALGKVLRAAMGNEGWEALRDFPDLTAPQLKRVLAIVMEKVMGVIEEEKGKS